jgi:hypothetical protein
MGAGKRMRDVALAAPIVAARASTLITCARPEIYSSSLRSLRQRG